MTNSRISSISERTKVQMIVFTLIVMNVNNAKIVKTCKNPPSEITSKYLEDDIEQPSREANIPMFHMVARTSGAGTLSIQMLFELVQHDNQGRHRQGQ